ncbi:hypothetical protein B1218_33425, partial [Pseudomonas ogarae]
MPDGETPVVANGRIRTDAESRGEMNLDAMEPTLPLMQRDPLPSQHSLPQSTNTPRPPAITSLHTGMSMPHAHSYSQLTAKATTPVLAVSPDPSTRTAPPLPLLSPSLPPPPARPQDPSTTAFSSLPHSPPAAIAAHYCRFYRPPFPDRPVLRLRACEPSSAGLVLRLRLSCTPQRPATPPPSQTAARAP